MKKSKLTDLLMTFMKIGAFTFGGGYAMIAMITDNCVNKKQWITDDEMMNVTVIAESTPGPIAINAATYIGFKQAGMAGAVAATLGMILPSFVLIYLISSYLADFLAIELVAKAFSGIKIAVGLLIADAGVNMLRKMPKKRFPLAVMGCAFAAMLVIRFFALPVSSIQLMVLSGTVSLVVFMFRGKKPQKGGQKK